MTILTTTTTTTTSGLTLRRAGDRGQADHGWLKSAHSFSFADYQDPRHMGFRSLRVINEDWIAPGQGFGMHPHRDMEIFTYVLTGTLEHRDTLGHVQRIVPGRVQLMSAGHGVSHSEYNPSQTEPLHLLQIWIRPRRKGRTPSYAEWQPDAARADHPKLLFISSDGRDGSATLDQDADIFRVRLAAGQTVTHDLRPDRGVWLQVAEGQLRLNGVELASGDAASTEAAGLLTLTAVRPTEAILFDLK